MSMFRPVFKAAGRKRYSLKRCRESKLSQIGS